MKTRKVLIDGRFIDNYGTGISNYTKELIRVVSLCPDIELTVLDTFDGNVSSDRKILTKFNKENHIKSLLWYSYFLQKKIAREKFDIFHSPAFNLPIFSYIKNSVTIHDMTPFMVPGTMPLLFRHYLRFAIMNSVSRAHLIICVSRSVKNDIIKVFGEKISSRISIWNPLYRDISNKRNEFIKKESFILFIGQDNPRKNLKLLLKVFPSIKEKFPDLSLKIAGISAEKKKENHGIEYLGYVSEEEKDELYRKSLVFVYPSLYEGFGIPIHEAFYHDCPVLASNIPVLRETAKDAAIFFDPLREDDLKEKLIMILSDKKLREDLVSKGNQELKEYRDRYEPQNIWKMFLQL